MAQFVKSAISQAPPVSSSSSKSVSELQQQQQQQQQDQDNQSSGQSGELAQEKVIRYHQFQGPSLHQSDFGQLEPGSFDSKNIVSMPGWHEHKAVQLWRDKPLTA